MMTKKEQRKKIVTVQGLRKKVVVSLAHETSKFRERERESIDVEVVDMLTV